MILSTVRDASRKILRTLIKSSHVLINAYSINKCDSCLLETVICTVEILPLFLIRGSEMVNIFSFCI